jgi:hypothetical protein
MRQLCRIRRGQEYNLVRLYLFSLACLLCDLNLEMVIQEIGEGQHGGGRENMDPSSQIVAVNCFAPIRIQGAE